jgi:hypothetical protein
VGEIAALLLLDLEAALGLGAHTKCVIARTAIWQVEVQPNSQRSRMAGRTTPDLVDAAPFTECVVQRRIRLADEPKRVQKLLFPEPFWPTRKRSGRSETEQAAMLL